jgi:hypothetical protein
MSDLFTGREHVVNAVSDGQLTLVAQVTALATVLNSGPKQDYMTLDIWAELSSAGDFNTDTVRIDEPQVQKWPIGGGYDRRMFRFSPATLASPSRSWNDTEIRFGPFTEQKPPANWVIVYSSNVLNPFLIAIFKVQGAQIVPGVGDSIVIPPGAELRPDLGLHARL